MKKEILAKASQNIYFLFPGHGSEKVYMTRTLYQHLPVYREELDNAFKAATQVATNLKLSDVLFPEPDKLNLAREQLQKTEVIQPALFIVEYALSRVLIKLGIEPSVMLGHSVGEYVAACIADVFSFQTALEIIIKRGQLTQEVQQGSMLATVMSADETEPYLSNQVSLAAINGPNQCVFSGFPEAITSLDNQLQAQGITTKRLHVTRAFHSMMLDPILERFGDFVASKSLRQPSRPFLSGLHGTWADNLEVSQADYWVRQLRDPVRFYGGITELTASSNSIFLEVGPNSFLKNIIQGTPGFNSAHQYLSICQYPDSELNEPERFFKTIAQLTAEAGIEKCDKEANNQNRSVCLDLKKSLSKASIRDGITDTDKILSEISELFCRMLGISEIDKDQNFLGAGGNSLMAMQVIARIREKHGISVPIRQFFEKPTVRAVAALVTNLHVKERTNSASFSVKKEAVSDDNNVLSTSSDISQKQIASSREDSAETASTVQQKVSELTQNSLDFGLSFFAADGDAHAEDRYKLVLNASKIADKAGFKSIWLPERHFNRFGGLYPNPSVLGAAIATVTKNIHIRGGSVVAPLHHPVRVAEEWAVIDNLSKGRIGIAFGSGFHPNDFLFNPDAFDDRKEKMFASIDSIRKLWRGGTYSGRSGTGDKIEVEIFPKPYSGELPVWLVTSRSMETFAEAGKCGAGVLTALLRLSLSELEERITVYREALVNAGHDPRIGKVAVMLHTFLGPEIEEVRMQVKKPLKDYLRSHMKHTRVVSVEKAEDTGDTQLSVEDEETLLDYAFERYLLDNSLIGTEASCLQMAQRLKQIGVDELACLVDFGLEHDLVMSSLNHLEQLSKQFASQPTTS